MSTKLQTAEQVIRFIENLSYCVDRVDITSVEISKFSFKVQVPGWYKIAFSKYLRKKINKELGERMYASVSFEFEIYSEAFF